LFSSGIQRAFDLTKPELYTVAANCCIAPCPIHILTNNIIPDAKFFGPSLLETEYTTLVDQPYYDQYIRDIECNRAQQELSEANSCVE
jgi:hypothetical protein